MPLKWHSSSVHYRFTTPVSGHSTVSAEISSGNGIATTRTGPSFSLRYPVLRNQHTETPSRYNNKSIPIETIPRSPRNSDKAPLCAENISVLVVVLAPPSASADNTFTISLLLILLFKRYGDFFIYVWGLQQRRWRSFDSSEKTRSNQIYDLC
jgi:hypothetical protein